MAASAVADPEIQFLDTVCREGLRREFPVEVVADDGFQIGFPRALVVQIIGVLPEVDDEDRLQMLFDDRCLRVVRREKRQPLVTVGHQPDPAAGEMVEPLLDDFRLQRAHRAEAVADGVEQGAVRFAAARAQALSSRSSG